MFELVASIEKVGDVLPEFKFSAAFAKTDVPAPLPSLVPGSSRVCHRSAVLSCSLPTPSASPQHLHTSSNLPGPPPEDHIGQGHVRTSSSLRCSFQFYFCLTMAYALDLKWELCSAAPNSLRPYGLGPTKFLCLRNSPGKNTRVGRHFLLQGYSWPRDWTRISCTGRWILCH